MRCPTCRLYHLGPCRPVTPRNLAGGPAIVERGPTDANPDAYDRWRRDPNPNPDAGVVTLRAEDATRILRAWEKANAGANNEPESEPEPRPVATCPKCGLTGIPICDDGQLAAHGWARGGVLSDGPLDEDGWPTPGEWSGCENRSPNASR